MAPAAHGARDVDRTGVDGACADLNGGLQRSRDHALIEVVGAPTGRGSGGHEGTGVAGSGADVHDRAETGCNGGLPTHVRSSPLGPRGNITATAKSAEGTREGRRRDSI